MWAWYLLWHLAVTVAADGLRQRISLDQSGWLFNSTTSCTSCTCPNGGQTECNPDYDDSTWRQVQLPHDYVVEGTFTQNCPTCEASHGYLPHGAGWYRLHFTIPSNASGSSIWIDFDGVYRQSVAYLNGQMLGSHQSGYTSFRYSIEKYALYGQENVLAVYTDATNDEGWWYEGGGIYRHVWLNIANQVHIIPWGVYVYGNVTGDIQDGSNGGQVTNAVTVRVQTEIVNNGTSSITLQVVNFVTDPTTNAVLGSAVSGVTLDPSGYVALQQSIDIKGQINLWSPDVPFVYTLTSQATTGADNRTYVDSVTTTFGFRSIMLDATKGFFLNNRLIKIKGMCNHQDFAGLGTALPNRINQFRVLHQKNFGANAWRMSHNPPNPELLDYTDQLGFLVWDENRNFADNAQYYQDFIDLLKRDRNHPSIVIWSLCNEGGCMEGDSNGYNVAQKFIALVKQYDFWGTRPVSAAQNGDWMSNGEISEALDILGINYNIYEYDSYHNARPTQPMIGSETSSQVTDRGLYANNATAGYLWGYDIQNPSVSWGLSAEDAWQPIAARTFMEGAFIWTGFDYKGEPTPYEWPNINSHFGIMDIAGFPKDVMYFYYTWWYATEPYIYLFPHWNWNNGNTVWVWAFANTASVELFVNGQSQGKKTMAVYDHVDWNVTYSPGNITAIGYDTNGKSVYTATRITVDTPTQILLKERSVLYPGILPDGADVAQIEVSIVDSQGRLVPTASNSVNFTISGPGRIIGVGNGDPSSHQPDKANYRSVFNGYALVIVQGTTTAGTITLTASSNGLKSASIDIKSSSSAAEEAKGKYLFLRE